MTDIKFGKLDEDGRLIQERTLKQSDIMACPHIIMVPEHYREDGSCRCDDINHSEMVMWGYKWDLEKKQWV